MRVGLLCSCVVCCPLRSSVEERRSRGVCFATDERGGRLVGQTGLSWEGCSTAEPITFTRWAVARSDLISFHLLSPSGHISFLLSNSPHFLSKPTSTPTHPTHLAFPSAPLEPNRSNPAPPPPTNPTPPCPARPSRPPHARARAQSGRAPTRSPGQTTKKQIRAIKMSTRKLGRRMRIRLRCRRAGMRRLRPRAKGRAKLGG